MESSTQDFGIEVSLCVWLLEEVTKDLKDVETFLYAEQMLAAVAAGGVDVRPQIAVTEPDPDELCVGVDVFPIETGLGAEVLLVEGLLEPRVLGFGGWLASGGG